MVTEQLSPLETPSGEATWRPEDFRRYLLALAYNWPPYNTPDRNFCLNQAGFPERIILDSTWQETFNRMRAETARDDHERWAMIGANAERDRLFISQKFVRASKIWSAIEGESMMPTISEAIKQEIPVLIGHIHSHPHGARFLRLFRQLDYFSVGDLFALLARIQTELIFLIGPNKVKVVFHSRETPPLPPNTDVDLFDDIWSSKGMSAKDTNIAIAKRYRLVLYEGKPDNELRRIFP